jgi:hypothetical protein
MESELGKQEQNKNWGARAKKGKENPGLKLSSNLRISVTTIFISVVYEQFLVSSTLDCSQSDLRAAKALPRKGGRRPLVDGSRIFFQ